MAIRRLYRVGGRSLDGLPDLLSQKDRSHALQSLLKPFKVLRVIFRLQESYLAIKLRRLRNYEASTRSYFGS